MGTVTEEPTASNGGTVAPPSPNIPVSPTVDIANPVNMEKKSSSPELPTPTGDSDDLAEKVIKDVTALYNARHNFEMMFVDNPGADLKSTASTTEQGKSKRERIIELSKALNAQQPLESEETKNPKKKSETRKDIIDEIVDTKSKIEPANEKQKEQL